ncbi:hypothetical protein HD806DRAFT_325911 [Xylariaceae sp. AK1471]|nr:hypothetical protein HD806DRAFT_325911 [Xylariaceae sp. AK1471]
MASADVLHFLVRYVPGLFLTYILLVFSYRIVLHPLRGYPGPFLGRLKDGYGGFYSFRRNLHRRHMKSGMGDQFPLLSSSLS